jgi:outer membrane lipoprotein-sorting protein
MTTYNKISKVIFAALFFVFSFSAVLAQNAEQQRIIKKIADANAKYGTVECGFVQVKHMMGVKSDLNSSGTLYFKRSSGQLNMKYDKPAGNQLLVNGDKLVLAKGSKKTAYSTKTDARMRNLKNTLVTAISGDVNGAAKENNASITYGDSDKYYTFELNKGKGAKNGVVALILYYSKKDCSLCLMKMEEGNGNYTLYKTPAKEFNKVLPAGIFE